VSRGSPAGRLDPGRRLQPSPFRVLFEISARVLRRSARVLLALAFVFEVPGALLSAAAGVRLGDTVLDIVPDLGTRAMTAVSISDAQLQQLLGALALVLAGSVVSGLLGAVAACGYAGVVAADYHARAMGFSGAASLALRRAGAVIGSVILSTLATLAILAVGGLSVTVILRVLAPGGVGSGGPGVFVALVAGVATAAAVVVVSVRWSLAVAVVALEDAGPRRSLARSWHLTGGFIWRTLAVLVVIGILTSLAATLLAQLLDVVLVDGFARSAGFGVVTEALVGAFTAVLVAPAAPVVQTVLYYDLRVRVDDWDVPPATSTDDARRLGAEEGVQPAP
jgi:hypothetical protein